MFLNVSLFLIRRAFLYLTMAIERDLSLVSSDGRKICLAVRLLSRGSF
jgi:hypothetical protein